jgi:hypothetical protein
LRKGVDKLTRLSVEEISQISEIQANYKCSWEDAIEIWNEDTNYMENGE